MSTLTVQIAVLDAAAESLAAVAGTVAATCGQLADDAAALGQTVPGSAAAIALPGLPLDRLSLVLSQQCHGIAARVAAAAESYRQLEARLQAEMSWPGRGEPVPR